MASKIHLNLILLAALMVFYLSQESTSSALPDASSRYTYKGEGGHCFQSFGFPCAQHLVCCNNHCLKGCGVNHGHGASTAGAAGEAVAADPAAV